MSNPFHINIVDPATPYAGGNTIFGEHSVRSGALSLNMTASNLDGGTLYLEYQPAGSSQWYRRSTGTFTAAELDANGKIWINTLIGEGKVRGVLEGSGGGSVIEEFILRPTHETDLDL